MLDMCNVCKNQPHECSPCSCHHAPCVHDLNTARREIDLIRDSLDIAIGALEWYADYGEVASNESKVLPSQGIALGMLQLDSGKRALTALSVIQNTNNKE